MVLDSTHNFPFIVVFVRGLNYLRVPKRINIAPFHDLFESKDLRSVDLWRYEMRDSVFLSYGFQIRKWLHDYYSRSTSKSGNILSQSLMAIGNRGTLVEPEVRTTAKSRPIYFRCKDAVHPPILHSLAQLFLQPISNELSSNWNHIIARETIHKVRIDGYSTLINASFLNGVIQAQLHLSQVRIFHSSSVVIIYSFNANEHCCHFSD
jgi:hypothetical protein